MDTASVMVNYTDSDFADAIRALLPKGTYWQEAENVELTHLIDALATDFKTTHDDIELSLLTEFDNTLFGWKISDYQALLYQVAGDDAGVVFDARATPNLIYVELSDEARKDCAQAWRAFENERLPHTEITWLFSASLTVQHQLAGSRHIRNVHTYKVTS